MQLDILQCGDVRVRTVVGAIERDEPLVAVRAIERLNVDSGVMAADARRVIAGPARAEILPTLHLGPLLLVRERFGPRAATFAATAPLAAPAERVQLRRLVAISRQRAEHITRMAKHEQRGRGLLITEWQAEQCRIREHGGDTRVIRLQ